MSVHIQEKGIVKKKRSKMVWDEDSQQWAPRHGYGRANSKHDKVKDWLVELKPGADLNSDPFEEKADQRKQKLSKQKMQEERNRLEAAHASGLGRRGAGAGVDSGSGGRLSSLQKTEKKDYLKHAIAASQARLARLRNEAPPRPVRARTTCALHRLRLLPCAGKHRVDRPFRQSATQ